MRLFFLLLLFIQFNTLRAQAPGMLGKTFLISAGIDPYAYVIDPSTGNNSFGETTMAANSQSLPTARLRLRAEVSTMLSRGIEVGLQYTRNSVEAKGDISSFIGRTPFLPLRGVRQSVQIMGRWFPKSMGGIAPSGFYLRLGGGLEVDRFTYVTPINTQTGIGEDFSLSTAPRFDFGLGYRYAPTDRLLLEIGFGTGVGRRGNDLTGNSLLAISSRDVVDALYFMDSFRLILGVSVPL